MSYPLPACRPQLHASELAGICKQRMYRLHALCFQFRRILLALQLVMACIHSHRIDAMRFNPAHTAHMHITLYCSRMCPRHLQPAAGTRFLIS